MQFIYPSFLWALLALAIPVIIHLFFFRRFKKVYFTNVKYLQEIKEETSSRNRLKNLLVLMSRLLALGAIILAFAQPFIPRGNDVKSGNSAVSLYIDNSFSMEAQRDNVPLLDFGKEKARQIIKAYSEEDRFQILTNDFEGRHQRLVSKEDALSLLDDIKISPSVRLLSQVIARQKQAISGKEENEIVYVLSDFQESTNDLVSYIDTSAEINLLPLVAVQETNVSLDSAWLESPVPMLNQNNKVIVKISNHGNEKAEGIRLSMTKDGEEKPEGTFDIDSKSSITDTINVTLLKSGWHDIVFNISDYPVQFDDQYSVNLNVPESINVLAINNSGENRYLSALFKGLNQYRLDNQSKNNVDYSGLNDYDLIILNDLNDVSSGLSSELDKYVVAGGNLLIFPSINANLDSYNNFLNILAANNLESKLEEKKTVSSINKDEFVFKDVFQYTNANVKLPTTNSGYKITNFQSRSQESLLEYRDGSQYLVKYIRGGGHVYLCTSPLSNESNDLAQNAEIFVPMLYKMAIASTTGQKISYTIGSDNVIDTDNRTSSGDLVYTISGKDEFIPGQTNLGNKVLLNINNQVKSSGFYNLQLNDNVIEKLAFNYNRKESNLNTSSNQDLEGLSRADHINLLDGSLKADFSSYINEKDRGLVLWRWFLIAALIFLGLETLLLRLWTDK